MINYSIVMRSVNANLLEINQAKSRINQAKKDGKEPDKKDTDLVKTEKQNAFAISQYTDVMTIEKFAKHVCHQCTEVVTILDTAVGSFAVVYTTAFTDLFVILFLAGLYDHLDINNLCLTDLLAWYLNQEPTTAFTIDWFVLYNYVWFSYSLQCVTLVARLSTARLSAWLAKRLCPALLTGSDTFLGWRDTAVTAVFLGLSWCT